MGKAQSVLGLIEPSELGKTLCHEHLFINSEALHVPVDPQYKNESERELLDTENLHWLRYFPYSHKKNLHVEEESILEKELQWFKQVGGKTIVDVTITGLRPALPSDSPSYSQSLAQLSRKTGVNIICGTGFYINKVHPEFVTTSTIEDLSDFMVKELTTGIDDSTEIKAGVIGEIGCSWPLTNNEIKVLKAAAMAQQKTGAPLIIHPGRNEAAPMEIVEILKQAGADIAHTVMSHLDRTIFTDSKWDELAATKIYLELDLFGTECSYYQPNVQVHMPHDGQRIERVSYLVKNGYAGQILLSHDIHTNHRLRSFGGHGYSHIFERIVPRLQHAGISSADIDLITIENPARWLKFVAPISQ